MATTIKQVIEVPAEDFFALKETNNRILRALENLKIVSPPEYLTIGEFMAEAKCSRWKVDALRECGKLNVIQRGRKLYIPRSEIQKYFAGGMEQPA